MNDNGNHKRYDIVNVNDNTYDKENSFTSLFGDGSLVT